MGPIVWVAIAAGVVLLAVGGLLAWRTYFDTYHYRVVQAGALYRDGNRSPREFANAMRRGKIKTVVALIDDREIAREPFVSEQAYCKANGIDIVRVPIKLGGWPTSEQVRQFLAVASDKSRQPLLVHCAQGVRRTGMMVAAYQESALGYDQAKAKNAILTFGHSERSIGDVRKFIDIYDPANRAVTERPPDGKEGGSGDTEGG